MRLQLLEELDSPGEWFIDPKSDPPVLYLWPNTSTAGHDADTRPTAAPPAAVTIPVLETLVSIDGANDVSFAGIEFTESRATFFEPYETPSG